MADKLKRLLELSQDEKTAFYSAISDLNEHLGTLEDKLEGFDTETLEAVKGEQGEPGYVPMKNEDYFTEDEIKEFLAASTPQRGKDYMNESDISDFLEATTPKKGVHYNDGERGSKFLGRFAAEPNMPSDAMKGDMAYNESTGELMVYE